MAKCSHAVEILPTPPIDIMTGSIKSSTFRVDQNGRNIVMPKVKQPNKTGRDSVIVQSAPIKWRTLTADQKQYWDEIAKSKSFYSRWTAFVSSFFLSVDAHGLDHTMNNELSYFYSKNRGKANEHFNNSLERRLKYQPDPQHYIITKETLRLYPVELRTELIYTKLLDLNDVNNALRCRMLVRTDSFIEYEIFPDPDDETRGSYICKTRPRKDDELYELLDISVENI